MVFLKNAIDVEIVNVISKYLKLQTFIANNFDVTI